MFFRLKTWVLDHEKDLLLGIFIALIATISFALGYLTAQENTKAPIVIEKVDK
jgi:hypothetical protein